MCHKVGRSTLYLRAIEVFFITARDEDTLFHTVPNWTKKYDITKILFAHAHGLEFLPWFEPRQKKAIAIRTTVGENARQKSMTKEKERERAKNNAKTIENAMKHRRMNIVPTFYANKKGSHTHSHFCWKIKRTETWNNQRGKNIEEDWSVNTTAWEARKMRNVWIFYDGAHKRFNRFIPFRCASNEWTNEKLKREWVEVEAKMQWQARCDLPLYLCESANACVNTFYDVQSAHSAHSKLHLPKWESNLHFTKSRSECSAAAVGWCVNWRAITRKYANRNCCINVRAAGYSAHRNRSFPNRNDSTHLWRNREIELNVWWESNDIYFENISNSFCWFGLIFIEIRIDDKYEVIRCWSNGIKSQQ